MKRIINYIFLCSLLWIGCTTTTEGLDPEKVITVSNNKIEMDCTGGKTSVEINSYCDWVITNDEEWEWISVSKKSGEKGKNTLGITLDQNNTTNIRNAVITLANQRYGVSQQINITQNSIDPFINISENRYEVSSTGTSKPIEIESNIDWTASCDSEWVSIEPTNGSSGTTMLEIKAQGYISDNNRTATITVKGKNNHSNIEKKITVIQEGEKAYMKLLAEELNFGASKDSQSIAIESNCPWKANINADWINISPENGTGSTSITVSVTDNNSSTTRDGIVIFYNHDYNLSITLNVKQYQSNNYIEYTSTMMLSTGGIDWGANILSHTYDNDKGVIVFDAPITKIPSCAFDYSEELTGITIPNSVTEIGAGAFHGCTGLTSITLPNSLTKIGYNAFYGCTGLTSITLPNSLTEVGENAFYGCSGLTSITLPNSLTEIGSSAFYRCTGLTSITLSNSLTKIGSRVFSNCKGLTKITIPNSVTEIGEYAFYGCTGLTSITLSNRLTKIGEEAFKGCTGLTKITIPNSVTEIGFEAFSGCSNLTSITLSNRLTEIGPGAFSNCTGLTKVTIPNSVTEIKYDTFSGCSNLTSITLPNNLTEIGDYAFLGCTSLVSISIPENVTEIGDEAFSGCIDIRVKCLPTEPPCLGYNTFEKSIIIQVKIDCFETYIKAWPEYASQIYVI